MQRVGFYAEEHRAVEALLRTLREALMLENVDAQD